MQSIPKVVFEMILLIAGCMAFHSVFSKMKFKFKMWFLLSLSIIIWFLALLGCGNRSRTWRIKLAFELVSEQFEFLEDSKAKLSTAKNSLFKDELWVDGYDGTSFGKAMLPFDDFPIADEGSRCNFIAWRRSYVAFDRPLDLNPTIMMSWGIHRSH